MPFEIIDDDKMKRYKDLAYEIHGSKYDINKIYTKVFKKTGKQSVIIASKEELTTSEFLNSNHRCNGKTYYYLRLIKEHMNVGLVVHSE